MNWYDVAVAAVEYHGAQQDADELAAVLAILADQVHPRCVLEIGTAEGGSAWAWAQIPTMQRIITVDSAGLGERSMYWLDGIRIEVVTGVSQEPSTRIEVVGRLNAYDPDVVYVDGDHTYESVVGDWENYSPLVAPDGVVVLHDSQGYPGREDFGVGRLVAELRAERPVMEVYSRLGGPAGTAIVWASPKAHGLTFNEREAWQKGRPS